MFGYVKPAGSELRVREYEFYNAAYCGVCRRMKAVTGWISTCSLSYDFVFFALCRMLLTNRQVSCERCRCISHICKGKNALVGNEALDLTARIAAVLTLAKLDDDVQDEKGLRKVGAWILRLLFRGGAKRAKLPDLQEKLRELLAALSKLEKEEVASMDAPADVFGQMLAIVFAWELSGEDARVYAEVGYHLGKFIYAADAFDDWEEDLRKGRYNPLRLLYPEGKTAVAEQTVKTGLYLELEHLGRAVEALPFGDANAIAEIIRNTVYIGLPRRIEGCGKDCKGKKKKTPSTPKEVAEEAQAAQSEIKTQENSSAQAEEKEEEA